MKREGEAMLRAEALHVGYGNREVLRGVSLEVQRAEIVALIGANGAGKSTLLKALAGILRPYSGRVLHRGQDVTAMKAYRRARLGMSYVMQGGATFHSLTTNEHFLLAARAARSRDAAPEERLGRQLPPDALAEKLGPAGLFSGGQQQALAVATALAMQPDVLLCDEPSAGLAPSAAADLLRQIAEVSREKGIPVLWVEQNIREILQLADRAILLRDGKAVAETSEPLSWLEEDFLEIITFGKL